MRNLEIKAAVFSLGPVRSRLRRLEGACRHASLRQTDWYFCVPAGRLKLRTVGARRDGELIAYLRPDRTSARTSEFQLLPTADAAGVRALLEQMLGVRACVRKRRDVWLFRNARIHLDTVDGLGCFVEIEVVVTEGMAQARALMRELRTALGIRPEHLIAGSYLDVSGKRFGHPGFALSRE
ncbi:MAG: class IV adenylate cyclase [Vicinamibacterales bacterium]